MYLMGKKFVLLFELTFKCTNHIFYDLPDNLSVILPFDQNCCLRYCLPRTFIFSFHCRACIIEHIPKHQGIVMKSLTSLSNVQRIIDVMFIYCYNIFFNEKIIISANYYSSADVTLYSRLSL